MTKATIRSNLTAFSPDIDATLQQGLQYVLGETNSYSCHGAPGVSNTAGAAIWAIDYILYAAQLNISRVHFHDGIGYKYNLVCPISNQTTPCSYSVPDSTSNAYPLHFGWIPSCRTTCTPHSTPVLRGNHSRRSYWKFWKYTGS